MFARRALAATAVRAAVLARRVLAAVPARFWAVQAVARGLLAAHRAVIRARIFVVEVAAAR